jgi:TctA family transporter
MAERALRQSLIISEAGMGIFFLRPLSGVLMVAALLAVVLPALAGLRAAYRRRAAS